MPLYLVALVALFTVPRSTHVILNIAPPIRCWQYPGYCQHFAPDQATFEQISKHSHLPTIFTAEAEEEIVAVCCSLQEWEHIAPSEWTDIEEAARKHSWQQITLKKPRLLKFLWDLLDHQGDAIAEQYAWFTEAAIHRTDFLNAHVVALNAESVAVGENSSIAPFVVLDATSGPIIIGSNVTIMPHTTIIGPCAIGDYSTIKAGAKIYGGTVIGQRCKVGGEVECSTFQNYSNKQHDGYVGHSFISEWINIGAGTNTSNLKNTYRPISVELASSRIPTGRTFLGLLCGDHTKVGINTMFTTGTVVGICANIFGSGYTPRLFHRLPGVELLRRSAIPSHQHLIRLGVLWLGGNACFSLRRKHSCNKNMRPLAAQRLHSQSLVLLFIALAAPRCDHVLLQETHLHLESQPL